MADDLERYSNTQRIPLPARHQNPVHLENNSPLDLVSNISDFTSNEKHHVFPKAYLDREGASTADIHALPNFCFLPADLNKRIRDSKPSQYFNDLQKKNSEFHNALKTHLLPTEKDQSITQNDYLNFLKIRAELVLEEIGRLCGTISTPRREERQQTIEDLEVRFRSCIHDTLLQCVGEKYWKQSVPPAVRDPAQGRIDADLKKHPDLNPEQLSMLRTKLDYINVADYQTIVENRANWIHFEPRFSNKNDFCNYLSNFSTYRNKVMHNSPMSELVKVNGEAAMIWFDTVLPLCCRSPRSRRIRRC